MRSILFSIVFVVGFCSSLLAQTDETKDKSPVKDTADVNIINVNTDSFPVVSIIFKAETRTGKPVGNLVKEKINFKENSNHYDINSLEPYSKSNPLNIGIVLDHSASMVMENESANSNSSRPKSSTGNKSKNHTPMEDARASIRKMIKDLNFKKDNMSVVAFCNTVDKKLHLTNDTSHISTFLDSMYANSTSAIYDGMIAGINQVKNGNGLKVLVVFTDGNDNASKSKLQDVVKLSLKEKIPVFIVGLGNANKNLLEQIAFSTKGELYLMKTPADLNTIYARISKKLSMYYNLVYTSTDLASTNINRPLNLSFTVDSLYVYAKDSTISLPEKAISGLKSKEMKKQNMMYGGIGLLMLIIIIIIIFMMRSRRRNEADKYPVIYSALPNPTTGKFSLNYAKALGTCIMEIRDASGQMAKTLTFSHLDSKFDLSELATGTYDLTIECKGLKSNAIKLVIQK